MTSQKNYFLLILSVLILSCSNDDNNTPTEEQITDEPVTFTKFKRSSITYEDDPSNPNTEYYVYGQIIGNKYHSSTTEVYTGGQFMNLFETQNYFYQNDNLVKLIELQDYDIKHFYYDSNNNLIGIHWNKNEADIYYRIIHPATNVSFFEKVTLPHDDPNTEIMRRHIVQFDENDNIVKAGLDNNKDGIMDYENLFSYDENGNITHIELHNGQTANLAYTDIKNTHLYVLDNSYGKKLKRLICSEVFGYSNMENIMALDINSNIRANTEYTYDVLENNFFNKSKIITEMNSVFHSITLEFFTE